MARVPRERSRSGIYHIMIRGINKQTIFEDDEDRRRFIWTLKRYKEKSEFQLYSYCLMDNHVHLLLKEEGESISETIKRIGTSYVHWYNLRYDRCGPLYQGRFRSEGIETDASFIRVLRYIHQNPLKAGLAKNVLDSKWTSINEYVGKANLIDTEKGLKAFSKNRKTAIPLFVQFMQEANDDQYLDDDRVISRVSDSEIKEYLLRIGIVNISQLQQMKKSQRNEVILKLKEYDRISVRQLSRVTGISKSVIHRIR